MIIESGVIIFLGLLFLGFKLPLQRSLRLLGKPLRLDITVSVVAYILHFGTFSGVMAAAVAGLMCSGFTSLARYAIGYIANESYFHGKIWNLESKVCAHHAVDPQEELINRAILALMTQAGGEKALRDLLEKLPK